MENHFDSLETGNHEPGHGRWTVNIYVIEALKIDVKDKLREIWSDQAVFPFLEEQAPPCRQVKVRMNASAAFWN
jgi:hypothetical protein